jgi:hypothetical protein
MDFIFALQGFYGFGFSFYVLGLDSCVCLQASFVLFGCGVPFKVLMLYVL